MKNFILAFASLLTIANLTLSQYSAQWINFQQKAFPKFLTKDANGNLYSVSSISASSGYPGTIVTSKYDTYGNLSWTRPYIGAYPDTTLGVSGIAVDAQGKVNVGCTQISGSGQLMKSITYNNAGSLINDFTYSPPVSYAFEEKGILTDNNSNVYLIGNSSPDSIFIVKQNDGGIIWVKTIYGRTADMYPLNDGCDYVFPVTMSATGNIAITGSRGSSMLTLQLDQAGNVLWSATYASSSGRVITTDKFNNTYVLGYSFTNTFPLLKYNSSGAQVWLTSFNLAYTFEQSFKSNIAIDSAFNVFIRLRSESDTAY